jgi:Flp pilus assembly protein TadG
MRRKYAGFFRSDRGSVTAEFAVVLPAVVVVALLAMSLGRAVVVNASCQEAARSVAQRLVTSSVQTVQTVQTMQPAQTVTRAEQAELEAVSDSVAGEPTTVRVTTVDVVADSPGKEVSVTCPLLPGPLGVIPASVTGYAVAVGS